ncbi:hypothetical protein SPFM12_00229 [Salmonella phage SPFM12]|nr:hypothetical protein SPFM12_00229 [Salmonella phage SPFM12]
MQHLCCLKRGCLPKDSQFYYVPMVYVILKYAMNKQPVPSEVAARLAELVLACETFYSGSYSSVLEHCLYLYRNAGEDMVAFLPLTYKPYLLNDGEWPEFEAFEPVMFPEYQAWSQFSSTRYFTSQIRQLAT